MGVGQEPVPKHHGHPDGRNRAVSQTELGSPGYPIVVDHRLIEPAHFEIEGSVEGGEHAPFAFPRFFFVCAPENDVVSALIRDYLEIRVSERVGQLIRLGS